MILDSRLLDPGPIEAQPAPRTFSDAGRMRITVVFTTVAGTLAALESAVRLARNLNAEIVLLVAEVIYFRYALDHPPVPPVFFENLCLSLIDELDSDEPGTEFPASRIEVHFCRDQLQCLHHAMSPRSLVVMGAQKHWWNRRERRLERDLQQLGHNVLLVEADTKLGKSRAKSVALRLLK